MMFLDIDTVGDVHFTLKDVAWFVGLIVSFGTAWFKLKIENAKQNEKINGLTEKANNYYSECKKEFENAKNGRVAIRRDFESNIISNNTIFSNRLDKVDRDIKDIGIALNEINVNISAIKTKLEIQNNN